MECWKTLSTCKSAADERIEAKFSFKTRASFLALSDAFLNRRGLVSTLRVFGAVSLSPGECWCSMLFI